MPQDEVTTWMFQLANGDSTAASPLWDKYFSDLVRLATRKLGGVPLRDVAPEDIALSAMQSFYHGITHRKFDAMNDRTDLWKLLVTITARKVTAHRRRHFAQKRGGGMVRGESVFEQYDEQRDNPDGIGNVLGTAPTPEFAVSVAENCESLLQQLADETLHRIAVMTLEGYRTEEIALKLDCAKRTVERKLARIREIWSEKSCLKTRG